MNQLARPAGTTGCGLTTFSQLFQSHSRDVYRFALFLSGDHDLAEDIVSETFIRVWHARERLDLSTVKAYLLAIARNLYLDQRRRAARHTALVDDRVDPRPGPSVSRDGGRWPVIQPDPVSTPIPP